jgi:hypothetical protein
VSLQYQCLPRFVSKPLRRCPDWDRPSFSVKGYSGFFFGLGGFFACHAAMTAWRAVMKLSPVSLMRERASFRISLFFMNLRPAITAR